jgi:protein-S-isoprenylcysteine O-methyltransferase Ste14
MPNDLHSADAPNVRIIPPLIYLVGLAVGFLANRWMPVTFLSDPAARLIGAAIFVCGAMLAGAALVKFGVAGTTVRPDRAASALVIAGPYKITRNPMYVGLALIYSGIAIAGQSVWAIILLPIVLIIIQRCAIEQEEAFLRRRFGAEYIDYTNQVRRWV